jgi:hypothetical protein
MKRFAIFILFILILSCHSTKNDDEGIEKNSSGKPIYFPYAPRYENGFEAGRSEYIKVVLDIWKEYETGDVRKKSKSFADSVTFIFRDEEYKGKKDSVLSKYKKRRDNYSYVQNHIDSWMPAYAKDHDDYWVFLWGRQDCTDKEGGFKALQVHEIWRFNKEGKINFMQEYVSR